MVSNVFFSIQSLIESLIYSALLFYKIEKLIRLRRFPKRSSSNVPLAFVTNHRYPLGLPLPTCLICNF